MKFLIFFKGRKINAIGIAYLRTEIVVADKEEAAIIKLYDRYEHISILKIAKIL